MIKALAGKKYKWRFGSLCRIEDIKSLEDFTKYLSVNISGLISYENISKNIKLSFQTIKKYLDAMEKSYLIARTQPFYRNKSKEITKQPKVYFIDTGLRNAIAKEFDIEISGKLFENYVFSELVKMGFISKYWRTKSKLEIDFIIEKDSEVIPIEAKINAPKNVERNLRAFIETYRIKRAFIVFYKGENKTLNINGCKVFFTGIFNLKKLLC